MLCTAPRTGTSLVFVERELEIFPQLLRAEMASQGTGARGILVSSTVLVMDAPSGPLR